MNRAEELAEAHWAYIKALTEATVAAMGGDEIITPAKVVELVGFHYVSSFIHGYGHGAEDEAKIWLAEIPN